MFLMIIATVSSTMDIIRNTAMTMAKTLFFFFCGRGSAATGRPHD